MGLLFLKICILAPLFCFGDELYFEFQGNQNTFCLEFCLGGTLRGLNGQLGYRQMRCLALLGSQILVSCLLRWVAHVGMSASHP
jgi:hypothetical protein